MSTTTLPLDDKDHEIISMSTKPFASLPLFLPSDVSYDPETNSVTPKQVDDINDDDNDGLSTPRHHHLVLVPNAGWDMLRLLKPSKAPISVISCVGPYRTGKSLLVSRFVQDSKAFRIGPTLEGCTRGIWISTSALKQTSTGIYKFVLDCEGMGDPIISANNNAETTTSSSSVQHDARIALACVLLSNVFVFNNTSHPDRGSLSFLNYLDTIRKRIIPENHHHNNNVVVRYPSFVWVFRDFFLQLPPRIDDPTQTYTLEEYMLERVLQQQPQTKQQRDPNASIVNSLLQDFANFQVRSIGYPKKKQGQPFGLDEMAHLGDVPWQDFEESFQHEMNAVIQQCLEQASTPFSLGENNNNNNNNNNHSSKKSKWRWSRPRLSQRGEGAHATGSMYAKWCETVMELVNSEGVIPNIPDLQHQLLQSLADEQVQKCIETYKKELHEFWESSMVYNMSVAIPNYDDDDGGGGGGDNQAITELLRSSLQNVDLESLIGKHQLQGVADADKLIATSIYTSERLQNELTEAISSDSILIKTLDLFRSKCSSSSNETNIASSILAQMLLENTKRSHTACEVLAQSLYAPIRHAVRQEGPTTPIQVSQFESVLWVTLKTYYLACARGPAKMEILAQCLQEPFEADVIFLKRLQEKQSLLDNALEEQRALVKDIQEKQQNLLKMSRDLKETREKSQRELENIKAEHTQVMKQTLAEQKQQEEMRLAALEIDMQAKLKSAEETLEKNDQRRLSEMHALKEEAESRLFSEVSARDERMRNEQMAYEAELARIRALADDKLEEEIKAAEERRIAEQEKIKLEMEAKLLEAERKMQDEIRRKQEALLRAEEEMKRKDEQNSKLLERVEEAESQLCPSVCCCM